MINNNYLIPFICQKCQIFTEFFSDNDDFEYEYCKSILHNFILYLLVIIRYKSKDIILKYKTQQESVLYLQFSFQNIVLKSVCNINSCRSLVFEKSKLSFVLNSHHLYYHSLIWQSVMLQQFGRGHHLNTTQKELSLYLH